MWWSHLGHTFNDFSNSALYKIESHDVHLAQTPSGISLRPDDFVVLGKIFSSQLICNSLNAVLCREPANSN